MSNVNIINASGLSERELFGSRKVDYPIAGSPDHKVVSCSYLASASAYSRRLMSSAWEEDPTFILVDEQIEKTTGDLIYFSRKWSNIPSTWNDAASMAFTFPGIEVGDNIWRVPVTYPVVARIQHDYFVTTQPFEDIPMFKKFAVINAYGYEFEYLGGPTAPHYATYIAWISTGEEIIAQDSTIERYLGDIWVRKSYYVKAR